MSSCCWIIRCCYIVGNESKTCNTFVSINEYVNEKIYIAYEWLYNRHETCVCVWNTTRKGMCVVSVLATTK